jgi:PAS domain S-box-containing protein
MSHLLHNFDHPLREIKMRLKAYSRQALRIQETCPNQPSPQEPIRLQMPNPFQDKFNTIKGLDDLVEDFFLVVDLEFRIRAFHGQWLKRYGRTEEFYLGKFFLDFIREDYREQAEDALRKSIAGVSTECTVQIINHSRWIAFNMVPVRSKEGEIKGVMAMGHDISDYHRTQELNREREKFFKFLVENTSDMIITLDDKGRFIYASPNCEKYMGFRAAYLARQTALAFLHPDDWEKAKMILQKTLADPGYAVTEVLRARDQQGVWHFLETTGKVIVQEDSQRIIVISARDITVRLETQRQRMLLEEAIQRIEEGILVLSWDKVPRFHFVNKGFETMTGLDLAGLSAGGLEILRSRETNFNRWEDLLSHLNQGKPWNGDFKLHRSSGASFDASVEIRPLAGGQGTANRVMTIRDVTETKRAQELLLKYERFAIIGEVTAGIAHEIKNPLAIIRLNAQGLQEQTPGAGNARELETILGQCDRVSRLLQETLNFQPEKNAPVEGVSLGEIITKSLYQARAQFGPAQSRIKVALENMSDFPQVPGHALRLTRLFMNIILNAYQAMVEQGGLLTLRGSRRDGYALVEISDTGPGVPEKDLDRLFEPFFTTKLQGSGLGLAVCQHIAKDHRGWITAVRRKMGVTFEVWLPLSSDSE